MGRDDEQDREEQNERLRRLVRGMRIAQKNYFKTRDPETLNRSKEAERRVDLVLFENRRLDFNLGIEPEVSQGDIFGPDGLF